MSGPSDATTLDQLDADAARLLEDWAAAAIGPVEAQPLEELRNSGLINDDVTGPAPALWSVFDVNVDRSSGPPVLVRIYRPSPQTSATIVYAHGGGWTLLSIDAADTLCRHLAAGSGCAVVSVDYRLSPEHPFPAAFDDMFTIARWVAHGGLGWIPVRLGVAGDSAGGNLSAAVALEARDTKEFSVDVQILLYPATALDFDTPSMQALGDDPRFRLSPGTMRWFWSNYLSGDLSVTDQRAVPAAAEDLSGVAPAIVVTPCFDPLSDDGRRYASRLRDAGVDVDLIQPPTLPHGFAMMLGAVPAARTALDDVITKVRRAMNPLPALAEEFRHRPFGTHSSELQQLLHRMRSQPIAGKHFLFISETNSEWVLGRYSEDNPPKPLIDWSVRFSDLEAAEWHVFKLRWFEIFGEELFDA